MRVCYFNYEWDLETSTGAATQVKETQAALERLGHRVVVIDRHRKPAHREGNGLRRPGGRWFWETANFLRSISGVPAEVRILRLMRPDVVLTLHALRFSSLVAARRLGLPVVLQVNAPVPHEIRRYRPEVRLVPGAAESMEQRMLRAADGVIVVSHALRDYFVARGVRADQIAVVPNGADTSRFRPEAADKALLVRFPGRMLIGFIGSFAPYHGLYWLEFAIREMTTRYPAAHFVLVGGGPNAANLAERCRRYGGDEKVTLLGRVPHEQVPGLAAAMDVLLAPYPPEEFFYFSPIKLFEYMASGRAVLAARQGQIAEVIETGRNGMLYDPANPRDFLEKLQALLDDPLLRARLGAAARRTIGDSYTWDHAGQRISDLLEAARAATSSVPRPSWRRAAACR